MPVDTQADAKTSPEETTRPPPTDTLSDPLLGEAPPVEDPAAQPKRDAAAQYAALLAYTHALEAELRQLPMDCEPYYLQGEADARRDGDMALAGTMVRFKGAMFHFGDVAADELSKSWLLISASLPSDPTTDDYLSASQGLLGGLEIAHQDLMRIRGQPMPEALGAVIDEKLAALWQRCTEETARRYDIAGRAAKIEAARSDRSLVEGLSRALEESSGGD